MTQASTTTARIAHLLEEKRGDRAKREVYELLDVAPQTYDGWENDWKTPPDEYIRRIAVYLGVDEDELALMAYHQRTRTRMGVYVSSVSRFIDLTEIEDNPELPSLALAG